MAELHRGRDAELCETRHVVGREQLRVLDALTQSQWLPIGAGRLEGIERLAVGEVPDGVDADRKARPRGSADVVFQLFPARDLDAGPVEQAGRLGAERAVHE